MPPANMSARVPLMPCSGPNFLGEKSFFEDLDEKEYMGDCGGYHHRVVDSKNLPFTREELLTGLLVSWDNMQEISLDDCKDGTRLVFCSWGSEFITQEKYKCREGFKYLNDCYAFEGILLKIKFATNTDGSRTAELVYDPTIVQFIFWNLDAWNFSIPWFKEFSHEDTLENDWGYDTIADLADTFKSLGFKLL